MCFFFKCHAIAFGSLLLISGKGDGKCVRANGKDDGKRKKEQKRKGKEIWGWGLGNGRKMEEKWKKRKRGCFACRCDDSTDLTDRSMMPCWSRAPTCEARGFKTFTSVIRKQKDKIIKIFGGAVLCRVLTTSTRGQETRIRK